MEVSFVMYVLQINSDGVAYFRWVPSPNRGFTSAFMPSCIDPAWLRLPLTTETIVLPPF